MNMKFCMNTDDKHSYKLNALSPVYKIINKHGDFAKL